jgi:hypothetical protein
MIVIVRKAEGIGSLMLGRCGENEARQIRFDIDWLIETYGEGVATLVHERPKDVAPYIVPIEQTEHEVVWTVTDGDTTYPGTGRCEIRWVVGEVLAKTVTYRTEILHSITGDTVIPEPLQSWYDQMIDFINDKTITGASAETLPTGSEATASFDDGVLYLGLPRGDKGDKGDQGVQGEKGETGNGIASIEKTGTAGKVDTYTITMTDGTTATFEVTNGDVTSVNGQTGAVTLSLTASGDGLVTLGL